VTAIIIPYFVIVKIQKSHPELFEKSLAKANAKIEKRQTA
jgi:hypothetical protein